MIKTGRRKRFWRKKDMLMLFCYVPFFLSLRGLIVKFNNRTMNDDFIKTFCLKDFYGERHNMPEGSYLTEDFVLIRDLDNLPYHDGVFRFDFVVFFFCESGYVKLRINDEVYLLDSDSYLVCLPTMLVKNRETSPKCEAKMLGVSLKFMQRMLIPEKSLMNMAMHIYKTPVTHYPKHEIPLFEQYVKLIEMKLNAPDDLCRKHVLQNLLSALIYDVIMLRYNSMADEEVIEDSESRRSFYVFKRFLEEVRKDNGYHRSVTYYANLICYSTKYVSGVVKRVSGKTALSWINEFAIEQIKYYLKYSDMSMKEISDHFNFPNQSFFGKYVKMHLGISPARYRALSEDDDK